MHFNHHFEFNDIDQLIEMAQVFDLDFHQTGSGRLDGSATQVFGRHAHFGHLRLDQATVQRGSTPDGFRTFVIADSELMRMHWRGVAVDGRDLLIFPASNELHAVTRSCFGIFTVAVSEQRLAEAALEVGAPGLEVRGLGVERLRPSAAGLDRLRRRLHRFQRLAEGGGLTHCEQAQRWIDVALPRELLGLVRSAGAGTVPARSDERDLALSRVQSFLETHLCEAPSVGDLCRAAGVSERTLQYAFAERYGTKPKAFVRALRLAKVHRELTSSSGPGSVGEAAGRWGFWHMGQFAADYRQQFRQLPSTTLGERKSGRSHPG